MPAGSAIKRLVNSRQKKEIKYASETAEQKSMLNQE